MKSLDLAVRPLSPAFGAEILGLDLRSELSESVKRSLYDAWLEDALLLFRDQDLSAARLLEVASVFGNLNSQGRNAVGGMNYVSNVFENATNPAGELGFHQDHLHFPKPLRGIMLYALEVPPEGAGGDTLFSNSSLAYELLPQDLRERIDGLQIRHGERVNNVPGKRPILVDGPGAQRADHPLAFTHPDTGQKVIFLSGRHVDRILDVSPQENESLLDALSAYSGRPEITVRHVWRPGDLVLWDNLSLQHARTDFDPKHRRHLMRVQIV